MKQTSCSQSSRGQSSGGQSSGGQSSGGQSSGGHYCRATCPSTCVTIQPPPFILDIPGPSLYCPTQSCHIQSSISSGGMGGGMGGGMSGGMGQIMGGGGGGGSGGHGLGKICRGGRGGGGGRKHLSFLYEPEYFQELEFEPEPEYGSGIANLYYSRMGLPYQY